MTATVRLGTGCHDSPVLDIRNATDGPLRIGAIRVASGASTTVEARTPQIEWMETNGLIVVQPVEPKPPRPSKEKP